MICITGSEGSVRDLVTRVEALPDAPLQEARLDLLDAVDPAAVRALPNRARLVITCRSADEGGHWQGDEPARRALFEAALESGVRYVDLEADAPDETWQLLHSRFGGDRLVASVHRFEVGPMDPPALAALQRRITQRPASTGKLAVAVEDVADLDGLRRLSPGDGRPLVRVGMGVAGLVGRVRYDVLGSPWTYVTAPHAGATAPGQLPWDLWKGLRRRGADRLAVLVGGPQVESSPGPRVYNGLAAELSIPWWYAVAPTKDPARALKLLDGFGLAGASVTMPHKAAAAALASRLDDTAARLGAVNTLTADGVGGWVGHNTDGAGVLGAMGSHLKAGSTVAVLGTGGAARAAVAALAAASHRVLVVGRRPEAAASVARELGGTPLPWDALDVDAIQGLVNATPVGGDGESNPVSATPDWSDRVVLDMVLSPRPTPLLQQVARGGGVALSGLDMWVHQGAAQWALITGQPVTPEDLRRHLPRQPGGRP